MKKHFSTIKKWKFHFSRGEKSEGRRSGTVGRLTLTQIDAFYVPSMASPTNFFSPQNKRVWKAGRNSYTQALWYQKIKTSPCHILNKKSTGTTKTQRELCWQNRKFEADYFISGNCIEKVQESRQRVMRRVYTKDFERRKRLSIIIEDEENYEDEESYDVVVLSSNCNFVCKCGLLALRGLPFRRTKFSWFPNAKMDTINNTHI